MNLRKLAFAVVACALVAAQPAVADIISFDPDGPGPMAPAEVASFDFLPGNSLSDGAQVGQQPDAHSYTQYAQAKLGSLLDDNSDVIPTPGLNEDFEITITVEYQGTASTVLPGFVSLGLDADQPVNEVTLRYDDTPDANALAGTGYSDGDVILQGSAATAAGIFQVISTDPVPFDAFGANNYPDTQSIIGNGALRLDSAVASTDGDFFLSPIISMLFNTNSLTPFTETNPAQVFGDGAVVPDIGSVNGTGNDLQLQTDATGSFIIPEPATLALLSLGGLAALRRRR